MQATAMSTVTPTSAVPLATTPFAFMGRVRDLLDLLADVRAIDGPWTTAAGLRKVIELVLKLADMAGVNDHWTERLRAAVADERLFQVLLAVVRYVAGLAGREMADGAVRVSLADDGEEVVVDAQSFLLWLPLVIQLINLVRNLRRGA